jgi:transcriptional regulator with XRE-family HTH domain
MNNPVDTFKNRFNQAISIRNIKPVEISEKTGIGKSTISHYMSGYTKPKSDKLYLLAQSLDVNELWLMGYDVPMEKNVQPIISFTYDTTNLMHHTQNEKELLEHFSKLNLKGEDEAIKRVKELIYVPDYTKSQEEWLKEIPGTCKVTYEPVSDPDDFDDSVEQPYHEDTCFIPISSMFDDELNAAHDRTDAEVNDEMKKHDDDLMDNDKLWK